MTCDSCDNRRCELLGNQAEGCPCAECREEMYAMREALGAAKAAICRLGEIGKAVMVTDGDTTCSLAYWSRETLRRMGGQHEAGA